MISAECFSAQYLKILESNFLTSDQDKSVFYAVKELWPFFRLAGRLRKIEFCKPFQEITMNYSDSFQVKEENVLVMLSGGLGSTAALWWTLKQGYTPWVSFVDGFTPEANRAERQSVRRLVLGSRNGAGMPICSSNSDPRWITLPYVQQHIDKAHDLAMLYYSAYEAAKSRQCSRIVWGAVGEEAEVLKSVSEFFNQYGGPKGTLLIQSIFPFSSRDEILTELHYAEMVTDKILSQLQPNERVYGAVLPEKAIEYTHSCAGDKKPNWCGTPRLDACQGCQGCKRWEDVLTPEWRGYTDRPTQSPLLSSAWKPILESAPRSKLPSWSASLKRLANEPQLEAKRLKIAQELREKSLANDDMTKKSNNASKRKSAKTAKKAAAPKPQKKKGKKETTNPQQPLPDDESFGGDIEQLSAYNNALDSIFGDEDNDQKQPKNSSEKSKPSKIETEIDDLLAVQPNEGLIDEVNLDEEFGDEEDEDEDEEEDEEEDDGMKQKFYDSEDD